jgi:ceramide glucosyltransferase
MKRPDRHLGLEGEGGTLIAAAAMAVIALSGSPAALGGHFAAFAAALAILGAVSCLANAIVVRRFVARPAASPREYPPVTILKPLCGDEPLLEAALESCLTQDYPNVQVVFGLQDLRDPALEVVRRLGARHPDRDIRVVIDPASHGPNRKIGNLINMLPAARNEVLVFSDSDMHLPPDHLSRLVAALEKPGVGLVTCAYVGLPPAESGWQARLAASQINQMFLPGILLSRAMGRRDCLGGAVMIRRNVLARTGGLSTLAYVLADDNVLGQRVRDLGLSVALADALVATTVPEASLAAVWTHESRWLKTIGQTAPVGLALSTLQYPLFWAALAYALSGGAAWALGLFGVAWGARALSAATIGADLRRRLPDLAAGTVPTGIDAWLLPLRDMLSVIEIAASYGLGEVVWRKRRMEARGRSLRPAPPPVGRGASSSPG